MKMSKLWNHMEGNRRKFDGFSNLVDEQTSTLPRNLEPSRMCTIRLGSNPINREHVASAATGSSASTIVPSGRGVQLRGPLPSIATMPSAITKWTGTVAQRSRMLS